MHKQFWAGWLVASALHSLYQDILGKEKYIAMADIGWISGWYTVPLAFLFIVTAIALMIQDKRERGL